MKRTKVSIGAVCVDVKPPNREWRRGRDDCITVDLTTTIQRGSRVE